MHCHAFYVHSYSHSRAPSQNNASPSEASCSRRLRPLLQLWAPRRRRRRRRRDARRRRWNPASAERRDDSEKKQQAHHNQMSCSLENATISLLVRFFWCTDRLRRIIEPHNPRSPLLLHPHAIPHGKPEPCLCEHVALVRRAAEPRRGESVAIGREEGRRGGRGGGGGR
jgi:hypothetical protein